MGIAEGLGGHHKWMLRNRGEALSWQRQDSTAEDSKAWCSAPTGGHYRLPRSGDNGKDGAWAKPTDLSLRLPSTQPQLCVQGCTSPVRN